MMNSGHTYGRIKIVSKIRQPCILGGSLVPRPSEPGYEANLVDALTW